MIIFNQVSSPSHKMEEEKTQTHVAICVGLGVHIKSQQQNSTQQYCDETLYKFH